MIILKYKCRKIWDTNDFEVIQEDIKGKRQFSSRYEESVYHTWQMQCDYLQPGKSSDGSMALEVTAYSDEIELPLKEQDFFAELFLAGLTEVFGKGNVLSVVRNDRGPHISCTGIVFPLDRRAANPDKFLHPVFQDQPNDDVKKVIEHRIHIKFGEVYVSGESNTLEETARGYMPALIDFKPAPYHKEYDTILPYHVPDMDSQIQTNVAYDEMNAMATKIIVYFTTGPEATFYERALKGDDISEQEFMHKVLDIVHKLDNTNRFQGQDINILMNRIHRAIYKNYILEPLIDADEISDIMVIGPDNIRVKVGGERYTCDTKFINMDDYLRFIYALGIRNHLNLASQSIHVFSDILSNDHFRMRFNIVMPKVNSVGFPYLHIRKIAKHKRNLEYLIRNGMLDDRLAEYLIDRARNGNGITFVGKGASGKTTLMNMLLDYIPYDKSGLVIQESEELFSDIHPHLMFEHIVDDGVDKYDLQSLARNGLLTDLDYFIIGEVKGAEAKYFINAADTGHRCWCSVHSPSAKEGIDKLADYIMYETKYSKEECMYMLKNLGTIVFMKHFKVEEIVEIAGYDHEKKQIIFTDIFKRVH